MWYQTFDFDLHVFSSSIVESGSCLELETQVLKACNLGEYEARLKRDVLSSGNLSARNDMIWVNEADHY